MFKAIIPLLHWGFFLHTEAKKMKYFQGKKEEKNKLSFRNHN